MKEQEVGGVREEGVGLKAGGVGKVLLFVRLVGAMEKDLVRQIVRKGHATVGASTWW